MLTLPLNQFSKKAHPLVRSFSHYLDAVIVGGETAGVATACALSKTSFFNPISDAKKRLMLIHQNKTPSLSIYSNSTQNKIPDSEVLTISFSTLLLLHSLGALTKMNHLLITPYRKMFVNESLGKSYIAFNDDIIDNSILAQWQQKLYDKVISKHNYHFYGKNALGASVEHGHIKSVLYEILKKQNKCEIVNDDPIRNIIPAKSINSMSTIELESGRMIKTKLIIGNDGEDSYVRDVHNIESTSHSYNQKCIVRTLIHKEPLEGLFQRFIASGPIALLPLWGNYSKLVWSVPSELADELLEVPDKEFFDEVNARFYSGTKYGFGGYADILPSFWERNTLERPSRVVDSNEARQFRVNCGL